MMSRRSLDRSTNFLEFGSGKDTFIKTPKPSRRRPTTAKSDLAFMYPESTYKWHKEKLSRQAEERKKRRWLDSTLTPHLYKDASHKSWIPLEENLNATLQFSLRMDEDEEHKGFAKAVKCDQCGAYVNATAFDFHIRKCTARKKCLLVSTGVKYITGNFHRSPIEMAGNPTSWGTSTSANRSWWHSLPAKAPRAFAPIKTEQCPNCKRCVLKRSFELHKKKCEARTSPTEMSRMKLKWNMTQKRRETVQAERAAKMAEEKKTPSTSEIRNDQT